MKLSDRGVLEIAEHEGVVLGPYLDSVGVWTYGVGHTAAAGFPDPAKLPREDTRGWNAARVEDELISALRLFDDDLDKYEARVEKAIKVPLKQHEFDALVSFHFNTGAIGRASFVRKLNAGDRRGAADGMMVWNRAGGRVIDALTERRKEEREMFLRGVYPSRPVAVWRINGASKPIFGKPLRTLTPREALALMRPTVTPGPRTPEALQDVPEAPRGGFWAWVFNLIRGR
jgi:lysozyme